MAHYKMTKDEEMVKDWLINDVLAANGYKTFATHLLNYDLHLTKSPAVAALVRPKEGIIEINSYFDDEKLISVLIRHELLHLLLNHEKRAIIMAANLEGLDPHHLKKSDFNRLRQEIYTPKVVPGFEKYGPVSLMNVAGDYDLSKYYNKDDMELQDATGEMFGVPLEGLVLEMQHPEWLKMSYEELIDELGAIEKKARWKALSEVKGQLLDDEHFLPDLISDEKKDEPINEYKDAIDYLTALLMSTDEDKDVTFNQKDYILDVHNWGDWVTYKAKNPNGEFDTEPRLSIDSKKDLQQILNKFRSKVDKYRLTVDTEGYLAKDGTPTGLLRFKFL